jgi:hypothetical protein
MSTSLYLSIIELILTQKIKNGKPIIKSLKIVGQIAKKSLLCRDIS